MVKDRIVLLDSLRGLAVLGILLCNIPVTCVPEAVSESLVYWPHGQNPATLWVWFITQALFQQKFYTLFSMLFGASILLVGGEGGDRSRTVILVRRLVSLLAIGLFHGFAICKVDVLSFYAMVGLLALLVRSWPAGRLLKAGIGLHVGLSLWMGFTFLQRMGHASGPMPAQALARANAENQLTTAHYSGSFLQSLTQNAHDYWAFFSGSWASLPPRWPLLVLALMLMGMGLYKKGVLSGKVSAAAYRIFVGAGLGALLVTGFAFAMYVVVPDHPRTLSVLARWIQSATAPVVSLGYVGLMVMAAQAKVWRAIPAVLAPAGQMAFTNYLAQSVIMTVLFYGGRGPTLFNKVDRPALALIVVVIWTTQILWSRWWMARFTMGPLEWLWRLAYRGPMPLRREPKAVPVTA
jgi:uncharacterized protein